MKTKTEFLQKIVDCYRAAGEAWPATTKQIAAWAIKEQHWKPAQKRLISQCASEIAAAMRQEFFTDPQGRRVRRKHAYRDFLHLPDGRHEQLYFWIDIEDATHEQVDIMRIPELEV